MRKVFGAVGVLAGIWMVVTPWALPGHPMNASGNMTGMMHQQPAGVAINASSFYWHIVPGILAIALSLTAVFYATVALNRLVAAALLTVGVWSAAGPWVLPHWGLGDMMMSGVTAGSFARHIVPGAVLVVCAIGLFLAVSSPRRIESREAVPIR